MAPLASSDPIALPALPADTEEALAALRSVRQRTFTLIAHLSAEELTRSHSPIMSPLVWDLAHIAAYEDLWLCHRHGGLELLRPELAELYDAFETPRAVRAQVELLDPDAAHAYLDEVAERAQQALARSGLGDGTIFELVLRHELQHTETMLQTMALAGLLPGAEALHTAALEPLGALSAQQQWVEVAAGDFELGAAAEGFAYDNERPRHRVRVEAFQIALLPLGNAECQALGGPAGEGDPLAPACHIDWEEAERLARAAGARLPSEAEWERAATLGVLEGVGRTWEWTASDFGGYPGFVAHPYREYSEVFFGDRYKVLRGGSWATHERVKTLSFRNWDLPIRSQIFSGVRLARDAF